MALCPSCSLFELGTLIGNPSSRHGSWTFTLPEPSRLLVNAVPECAGCAFFKAVVASKRCRTPVKIPGLIILEQETPRERKVKRVRLYQTHTSFMDMTLFFDDSSREFDTFTVVKVGEPQPSRCMCKAPREPYLPYSPCHLDSVITLEDYQKKPQFYPVTNIKLSDRPMPLSIVPGQGMFDVILDWLHCCLKHDLLCPKITETSLPTRCLYIPEGESTLIQLRETRRLQGKYVALSHCWGDRLQITTTCATLSSRMNSISFDELPRTFQDAVTITKSLGCQYLWIDALCIIQGPDGDWAMEGSKMATVYGNAALVISAASARSGNDGILNPRHILESPVFGSKEKFKLQRHPGNTFNDLDLSPLSCRAWAFQERILAPRILHFTETQMIWECLEETRIECLQGPVNGSESSISRHSKKGATSSIRSLFASVHQDLSLSHSEPGEEDFDRRLEIWYQLVERYSRLNLTYPSDRLPAISGLAAAISAPPLGKYLAGLWESDIFFGLTWQSSPNTHFKPQVGPSWSWAAYFPKSEGEKSVFWRPRSLSQNHEGRWYDTYKPVIYDYETYDIWYDAPPSETLEVRTSITIKASYFEFYTTSVDFPCYSGDMFEWYMNPEITTRFSFPTISEEGKNQGSNKHLCVQIYYNDCEVYALIVKPVSEEKNSYQRVCIALLSPFQMGLGDGRSEFKEYPGIKDDFAWRRGIIKLV